MPPSLDDPARRALLEAPLGLLKAAREAAARDPARLADLIDAACVVLGVLGERAPGAKDLVRAVRTGAQAAAGLHAIATAPDGRATFPLGGRPLAVGGELASAATPERWHDGFSLACIARDPDAVATLIAHGLPGVGGAERAWASAIQRWFRREPGWDAGLDAALEGADARFDALHRPCVPLLRAIAAADLAAFDAALRVAVERHAAWWEAHAPSDPRGWIALHPLSFACLAEGCGLVTRVDAPGLPRRLVSRDEPSPSAALLSALAAALPEGNTSGDPLLAGLLAADDLAVQLAPVLRALAGPHGALVAARLVPRPADWARVFASGAEAAQAAYTRAWPTPPHIEVSADQSELDVRAFPARAIQLGLPGTQALPGGMLRIAATLQPEPVWAMARFHTPGAALGTRIDGLVWVDGRWIWIPKPWRG